MNIVQAFALLLTASSAAAQPQKHLILDSRIIERVVNAKLVLGTPEKHAGNPLFQADKPWENSMNNLYPNAVWDEQEKVLSCGTNVCWPIRR